MQNFSLSHIPVAHTQENRCVSRAKKERDRGRVCSWGSLQYDDSNMGSIIDRSDTVFKLLRLCVDINGDGTAGTMEPFTLDMDHAGMDIADLKAEVLGT
jgi:hypothetical protein